MTTETEDNDKSLEERYEEGELSIDELERRLDSDEEHLTPEQEKRLWESKPEHNPYTLSIKDKVYAMSEEWRESIERRAELAFEENYMFSCWWRVADADDEDDPDTVHEQGDPILVIETEGPIVPWEQLDQLEVEEDTSAFQEHDTGSGSDVDEGGGMKTVRPGDVQGGSSEEDQEIGRTHFGVTPRDFEELPSPDGERPDRIPPAPESFDEPKMVAWIPDHPDIDHSWSTGEAMVPVNNWVEWNVQAKADQPRIVKDKDNRHEHYEALAEHHDSEVVAKLSPPQNPQNAPDSNQDQNPTSGQVERKGKDQFENGKFGGDNWNI